MPNFELIQLNSIVMELCVQTPVVEFKAIGQTADLEMVEELRSHDEFPGWRIVRQDS